MSDSDVVWFKVGKVTADDIEDSSAVVDVLSGIDEAASVVVVEQPRRLKNL